MLTRYFALLVTSSLCSEQLVYIFDLSMAHAAHKDSQNEVLLHFIAGHY